MIAPKVVKKGRLMTGRSVSQCHEEKCVRRSSDVLTLKARVFEVIDSLIVDQINGKSARRPAIIFTQVTLERNVIEFHGATHEANLGRKRQGKCFRQEEEAAAKVGEHVLLFLHPFLASDSVFTQRVCECVMYETLVRRLLRRLSSPRLVSHSPAYSVARFHSQ